MHLKQKFVALTIDMLMAVSMSAQSGAKSGGPVTLQSAAAAGKVEYTFNGTGASSGDSIRLKVKKAPSAGSEPITVTVPPGSLLRSSDGAAQNMVISAVRGIDIGGGQIRPVSDIVLADQSPVTVVVSAFCAQFDKNNPSPSTTFTLDEPEPRLACATRLGGRLPIRSQQAAVWSFTDAISYDRMMRKLPLMRQEWTAAETLAEGCRSATSVAGVSGPATVSEILDLSDRILARDPRNMVALMMAMVAAAGLREATPEQLAAARGYARTLLENTDSLKPTEMPQAAWDQAKPQLIKTASSTMRFLAILPGNQAMAKQPKDCASAEAAYAKALAEYPDDATISFALTPALTCLKKDSDAVYQIERAAALDPTLAGNTDPVRTRALADSMYLRVHGSDEGLAQLKEMVKASPFPPDGFKIKTVAEIEAEKQKQFDLQHPELATWLKIKGMLSGDGGDASFKAQVEGAALPRLRGRVFAGKPGCNSREILVAVTMPDQRGAPVAEITLRLDAALAGKPVVGTEIQWAGGVPSAFTKVPFMLTIDIARAKIETLDAAAVSAGLKTGACALPAATKSPAKTSVPAPKKK